MENATLLHKGGEIPVEIINEENQIILEWNSYLNDEAVTVIRLDVEGDYNVDKTCHQFSDGTIEFNCRAMKVHGENAYAHYDGYLDRLRMLDWTDPNEYLSTEIIVEKPGTFELTLIYAALEGEPGEQFNAEEIKSTGSYLDPSPIIIGNIKIEKPGKYEFTIIPVDDGNWNGFRFQGVKMKLLTIK